MENRVLQIIDVCKKETSKNPFIIFNHIAANDFVRMHGPEHHVLDGACVLVAFHNAGGTVDINNALNRILEEGVHMPGAACGHWGVCGAVSSIGAALAIIDETGPLSTDGTWDWHMKYTSAALGNLAEVGGPRCCKRDAFLAMKTVIPFIKDHYGVELENQDIKCGYSNRNAQCIQERCPFYVKPKTRAMKWSLV